MLYISQKRDLIGSTELNFDCSACDANHIVDCLRFKTVFKFLFFIPIWVLYESAIKCPSCDATFRTRADLESLQSLPSDKVAGQFKLRIGLFEKLYVIGGWLCLLTIIPALLALILFVLAWFTVPKATRGWRLATVVGLVASALLNVLVVSISILT